MRILFLTQIIPYPPDAGPKVKTWNVLRYLASQGHQVTLASFVRPEEEPFLGYLREVCSAVHTVPIRRSRLADLFYLASSLRSGRPFLVERDDLPEMRALVQRLLSEESYDCIQADQLTMAQFALPQASGSPVQRNAVVTEPPYRIFDAHNAVWTITERMSETMPAFLKTLVKLEAGRVKRYEGMLLNLFDRTLAVTEIDHQDLLQAAEAAGISEARRRNLPISIIPIAVDTTGLRPVMPSPGSKKILALGTLHYPPNADGIRWFIHEVFSKIREQEPEAELTIVGKNPPRDFLQMASEQPGAIKVTGYVEDLRPYMEQSAVMVVPVRVGSGMRVRILEGLAYGIPMVTTTIGLEGIEARPGKDVLVADRPEDFCASVMRLLQDHELREELSKNGRRLAETRYDWQVVLQELGRVYASMEKKQVDYALEAVNEQA